MVMVTKKGKERCPYRVKLCVTCGECSHCGCTHDGYSVEVKLYRSVGGKQATSSSTGIKRQSTTVCLDYCENDSASVSEMETLVKTRRRNGIKRQSTTVCLDYCENDSASVSEMETLVKTTRRNGNDAPSSAITVPRSSVRSTISETLTNGWNTRKSIQLIRDFFGLPKNATRNFPNAKKRDGAASFNDVQRGIRVVAFVTSIL